MSIKYISEISWHQVHTMISDMHSAIHARIKDCESAKVNVYGIANGGIIPAVLLAKRFRTAAEKVRVIHPDSDNPIPLDVSAINVIVDDISDTGRTLQSIHRRLSPKSGAVTVTIHGKRGSRHPADICCRTIKDDMWIKYPWELPEETPNIS